MIATIPFTYRATVLRNGRRKPSTEDFVGHAALEIPEYSANDTIGAVSWKRTPIALHERLDLTTDLGRNSVRCVDDAYYFPVAVNRHVHTTCLPLTALRPDEPLSDEVFRELRIELEGMNGLAPHEKGAALLRQHLLGNKHVTMETTDPAVTDVLESNAHERRQAVLRRAETHIGIDGHLWKKVSQPVLVLQATGVRYLDLHVGGTSYGSPIIATDDFYIGSPARTMFFPVAEIQHAAGFAHDHDLEPRWGIPDYRVENPELTGFDRRADVAARTAEFVVHVHSHLIGNMRGDAITRWLEIRDMATEYRQDGNATVLDGVMEEAIPWFLATTGPLAGDEAWAEAHECLEIFDKLSSSTEPAMNAGSVRVPSL